ncbi:MAG TPA: hypothetical protein VEU51_12345 [Candidatus Acidoferrales bacterium]|nr:hypothetical protein [Candidatus Acidoferrales bacterium]
MKFSTGRTAVLLLVIALSTPAMAQEMREAKTCQPGSTSGKCLVQVITALQSQVAALQTALTAVQNNHALALGPFVNVDAGAENGLAGPHIIISGANVHIESGSGATVDATGLGNLVVGYDEDSIEPATIDANRTGSHNLIVGPHHEFTASGGAVIGFANFSGANYAGVTGGECNAAGGTLPLMSCSSTQGASEGANVSGGVINTASGGNSSVSGGAFNKATSSASHVSGGSSNTASGGSSSVSGGAFNVANTFTTSVSGGSNNTASGFRSSVSGGENNEASGSHASILGGNGITVSTTDGHSP